MAIGYKTIGLILLASAAMPAEQFPVRHEHRNGFCEGVLRVDAAGVAYRAGKHSRQWELRDIRELQLAPDRVYVLSYHGRYRFRGSVPVYRLYAVLQNVMDQRLVMEAAEPVRAGALWTVPVKRRGGADGSLAFGSESIVYTSEARDESRTWRYRDIDNITSSGPFHLTVTTFERSLASYNDRKDFNFELKQPITEAKYNELWLLVETKNGRIP